MIRHSPRVNSMSHMPKSNGGFVPTAVTCIPNPIPTGIKVNAKFSNNYFNIYWGYLFCAIYTEG
jgi:hypothetical protein